MGLTITATFEKQGIYFAGDTLECHIRFANERSTQRRNGSGRALSAAGSSHGPRVNGTRANGTRSVSRKFTDRAVFPTGPAEPVGEAAFPNLEGGRRNSVMAGTRGAEHNRPTAVTASQPKAPHADASSASTVAAQKRDALALFPSLGDGSPSSADLSPRPDAPRSFRGLSGAYDGRFAREEQLPAALRRLVPVTGGRGEGAMSPDIAGTNSRLSTSSVLSTPTTAFTSWLPFGAKQQQQQLAPLPPRKPVPSAPNASTPSEAGSSGLLSSLWRNISGGSNPPSRPATRAGTISEDDFGVERLAIGFAEASGCLGLSPSYIKPEQMELLLAHRGTDYADGHLARVSPVGGGLGGWAPAHSSGSASARSQRSLPLLISSPTVLFSELVMLPGESQTFSLKIQLPRALPPSFRGRSSCITYDLVIITKRSILDPSSHVVRIPFRVLACVDHKGSLEFFTLRAPIHVPPSHSQLTFQESTSVATPRNTSPSLATDASIIPQGDMDGTDLSRTDSEGAGTPAGSTRKQLADSDFLCSLLSGIDANMAADTHSVPSIEFGAQGGYAASGGKSERDEANGGHSMRNIQAVCHKRAPVSFSLSQGGSPVASVWLPKRAYQLGDLITGKIDLHAGPISVYQVSILLESVETVEEQFSSFGLTRTHELTRRVYAEHHEFCREARTLGFSLASLPTAAASFASSVISIEWQLRIELIIGLPESLSSDMRLSAVSSFPQSQPSWQPMSPLSPVPRSRGGTAATPRAPNLPSSALAPLAHASTNRVRSATIVGDGPHQLPLLHIVSRPGMPAPARTSPSGQRRSSGTDSATNHDVPPLSPQLLAETSGTPRALRRRYDVALRVPVQTLSCAVPVQMHPSLSKTLLSRQRDSYAVSLTKR
ncbi:Golgi membrane exchange factor (Ric1p-Rgp1p) subunit [Coemansia sp. RSA 2322]|nr:Golgi membrane exchange factor (Ric1p-Rgp1p) subunit [Coemansia sp. RSA 2322]